MNIREKLERLDKSASKPIQANVENDRWVESIEQELGVRVVRENRYFYLIKESLFPLHQSPYYLPVKEQGLLLSHSLDILSAATDADIRLNEIIFLDTETTGLAGGTGTYAFLIGVGFVEMDQLIVRQYLLPDFSHEWLMLEHLEETLRKYRYTVTFNGKTFDIPLLKSRYLLNRRITHLEEMQHLDLLHAARRIWSRRLPACDLQSLETHVLDFQREGDIPSELIPHIYFEFIRKREALLLEDVLEHNYYDVANMAMLLIYLESIAATPQKFLSHKADLFGLGNFYFQNRLYHKALPILENILSTSNIKGGDNDKITLDTYFMLARIHKKLSQSQAAKSYLWKLLERNYHHPGVIEELAKFYEHEDKDYQTAREIVERGIRYLTMVRELDPRSPLIKFLPALNHRKKRLERKIKKERQKPHSNGK